MSWLPEQPGNGLDRVYHALYENLPGAGVEVCGSVAGSDTVSKETAGKIVGFESDKASLVKRIMGQRALVSKKLKEENFDLIASHFALYTFPILGLIDKLPLVVHFHGPWAAESQVEGDSGRTLKFKKYIERRVYARADRFIVLSEAFRDVLISDYGIDRSKIRIVPGGADLDRFDTSLTTEEARDHFGWKKDAHIIVSVRRLARRMGLENLITTVLRLKDDYPDLQLKIGGKGPIEGELRELIARHQLEGNIEMLGYVAEEDLPVVYAAADLSVVPTLKLEGFGLITVESLAAGTPCLVTPVGGLPGVVSDLSPSLILPDTSVDSLVARLKDVLSGSVILPDREQCKSFARENYDWAAVARNTRAVYDEVV